MYIYWYTLVIQHWGKLGQETLWAASLALPVSPRHMRDLVSKINVSTWKIITMISEVDPLPWLAHACDHMHTSSITLVCTHAHTHTHRFTFVRNFQLFFKWVVSSCMPSSNEGEPCSSTVSVMLALSMFWILVILRDKQGYPQCWNLYLVTDSVPHVSHILLCHQPTLFCEKLVLTSLPCFFFSLLRWNLTV